ncbi:MAG TPA: hypothetical protein VIY48_15090 [Candidatus Paceibacterota bacterium]
MIEQLQKTAPEEESLRAEDSFRRAAFNWALSTKRLVESSNGLGANTKVAYAALVDIEYARDLLDKLFVPPVAKALTLENKDCVTKEEVQKSVSGLASRIVTPPVRERNTPFNYRREHVIAARVQAHVDDIVGAPPIVRQGQQSTEVGDIPSGEGLFTPWVADTPIRIDLAIKESRPTRDPQNYRGTDLSAPVYSKNGKMEWADRNCTFCNAKANQRCQKPDGTFIEKPHPQRKKTHEVAPVSEAIAA